MTHRGLITVRLDSFEGPLDLLLYFIQSHELDISKVSISKITDQYLAYVLLMQELNFDTASEFLVMAATLLHWKSKAILPQEQKTDNAQTADQEAFSQEDLIRQLLEHQRFLAAGESLGQLPLLGEDVFTRPNRRPPVSKVWKEMDLSSLTLNYQDLVTKARKRTQVLKKETVSLSDKLLEFGERLKIGKLTDLRTLLSAVPSKPETVVTFLASLELARLRKLKLYQEQTYGEIFLELLESLKNFNTQLASGFDATHLEERTQPGTALNSDEPGLDPDTRPLLDPAFEEASVATSPEVLAAQVPADGPAGAAVIDGAHAGG